MGLEGGREEGKGKGGVEDEGEEEKMKRKAYVKRERERERERERLGSVRAVDTFNMMTFSLRSLSKLNLETHSPLPFPYPPLPRQYGSWH